VPERAIYSRLAGSTGVTALLSSSAASITPMTAPQSAGLPRVTYQRIDTVPLNQSTGYDATAQARVQVDCWAGNYQAAKVLGREVRKSLRGYRSTGATPPIHMVHQAGEQDLSEPAEPGQDARIYRVSQDYLIDFQTT